MEYAKIDCEVTNIITKKIYLAGGMSRLSFEEQNEWREQFIDTMVLRKDGNKYICDICNPVEYYNFKFPRHESEKEVMRFDINKVRNSDLIVVNFNAPKSLGTMAEIAIAYERGIPVIGLNCIEQELHPWQVEICDRIFGTMEDLIGYIIGFYLN